MAHAARTFRIFVSSTFTDRWPRLWNGEIPIHLPDAKSFGECEACAISPDGTWVIAASYAGNITVLDLLTGRKSAIEDAHTHQITGCAVAPDGTYLASSSADRTVKIWDLPTGRQRAELRGHEGPVAGWASVRMAVTS